MQTRTCTPISRWRILPAQWRLPGLPAADPAPPGPLPRRTLLLAPEKRSTGSTSLRGN